MLPQNTSHRKLTIYLSVLVRKPRFPSSHFNLSVVSDWKRLGSFCYLDFKLLIQHKQQEPYNIRVIFFCLVTNLNEPFYTIGLGNLNLIVRKWAPMFCNVLLIGSLTAVFYIPMSVTNFQRLNDVMWFLFSIYFLM